MSDVWEEWSSSQWETSEIVTVFGVLGDDPELLGMDQCNVELVASLTEYRYDIHMTRQRRRISFFVSGSQYDA